jgi:dihydrodipicolinate synthase/N-acetylneuraminate lyase
VTNLHGCLPVLATPFTADGEIDVQSLRRLVELNIDAGVDGLVCFGLASELYKFDDADRCLVLATVMEAVADRVPVVAGCEHSGTLAAQRRCIEAEAAGAAGVMLYPPTFIKPSRPNIVDYFLSCASATDLPIIIQDAPAWTGVDLNVELLSELHASAPTLRYVKLEAPPIGVKAELLAVVGFEALSGFGAVHLAEDLSNPSVVGFMPGSSLPELFVRLWRIAISASPDELVAAHSELLPLLSFEMTSLDAFIETQKIILMSRGIFSTTTCRGPHDSMDGARIRYLSELLSRVLPTVALRGE